MNSLQRLFSILIFISSAATGEILHLDPEIGLETDYHEGTGGRGFVFLANNNFTMTSIGMNISFDGPVDFSVEVNNATADNRGTQLSQSTCAGLYDDESDFFTLAHTQDFTAGNTYEILISYSSPGVTFPHYNFDNALLNIEKGFTAGSDITVLDGTSQNFQNYWLADFQLTTTTVVPEPASVTLLGLGGILAVLINRRTRRTGI